MLARSGRSATIVAAVFSICFIVLLAFTRSSPFSASSPWDTSSSSSTSKILESKSSKYITHPRNPNLWPFHEFRSSPLKPPNITITRNKGGLADGFLCACLRSRGLGTLNDAPYIYTFDNELVFAADENDPSNDLRVQTINGEPHLTYWAGVMTLGRGFGKLVILDEEYHERRIDLKPDATWQFPPDMRTESVIDFHEQTITSRNTVVVTAFNDTPYDLTPIGGPKDGWVIDSLFFEIDLESDEVVSKWSALEHVAVTWSKMPVNSYMGAGLRKGPFDFFHINSIQEVGDDYFLVGGRHVWSAFLINRHTGDIVWELSGRGYGGDFGPLPEESQFSWQHHVRAHNVTDTSMEISIFDNHNMPDDLTPMSSRGLLLRVALPSDPVAVPELIRDIRDRESRFATGSQGSYQIDLEHGNQFLAYGPDSVFREYGPAADGSDLLWEAHFSPAEKGQVYRAYKCQFNGLPADWGPSLVVEMADRGPRESIASAFVSWNGATHVESWNVYAGDCNEGQLPSFVGQAVARGFETEIVLDVAGFGASACVQVGAVRFGEEVRRSEAVHIQ